MFLLVMGLRGYLPPPVEVVGLVILLLLVLQVLGQSQQELLNLKLPLWAVVAERDTQVVAHRLLLVLRAQRRLKYLAGFLPARHTALL
ncbi:MAG: hypothetical protein EBR82_35250 [Caulobacteraceae bacterium]|nr:hypothetical protein [Caulobacteraceae bacterium]